MTKLIDITGLSRFLYKLRGTFATKSQMAELQEGMNSCNSRLSALSGSLSALDGKVIPLQNNVTTLQNSVSNLERIVESLLPEQQKYFIFEAASDDTTLSFLRSQDGQNKQEDFTLLVSKDGNTWTPVTATSEGATMATLNTGEKLYVKNSKKQYFSEGLQNYAGFYADKNCYAYGNIMALAGGFANTAIDVTGGFFGLFKDAHWLLSKPNSPILLPATTLADSCYAGMFSGCTSLTTAPELPATTLAYSCYAGMFRDCTSLATAPELPATTLARSCYINMFSGCTSLTTAPELPATTLADSCYAGMFKGCTSLTTAPELPATTLADSCYAGMFKGCTSLTTAPELPATTLAYTCYYEMFNGCTSLNYIKALFTEIDSQSVLFWVGRVSPTGTFVKSAAANWDVRGASGIPAGWEVQIE